jgi:hypothetical protein
MRPMMSLDKESDPYDLTQKYAKRGSVLKPPRCNVCQTLPSGKPVHRTETQLTWLINPEANGPITGPRNGDML